MNDIRRVKAKKASGKETTNPVNMRLVRSDSMSSLLSMESDHSMDKRPLFSKETECMESMRALSQPREATCDVCPAGWARAVKVCHTCSASYCEAHIRHHYDTEEMQRHELEDINDDLARKLLSGSMGTKKCDTQSSVEDAQSLYQSGWKQERMYNPNSVLQKWPWLKGLGLFITFGCALIIIIFTLKESGRRSAPHNLSIMLVGKTGAGKSATGNTILGRGVFKEGVSPVAVTLRCETHSAEVAGRSVTVIDTPGIFDISISNDEIKREIDENVNQFFLLVVRLGRFTLEDRSTVKWIQENFGECALKYSSVLFTGGDELIMPVEEFLRKSGDLQEFINSCGGGYHVFNNREKNNRTQVTELLDKIETVLFTMQGYHHTTMMIQKVQRKIQAEEERKREEAEREIRTEEERKREEAEREIRTEEERKREEVEREIRTEEERKREEAEREIRTEEERKRVEAEREIRREEERKRVEAEREIRREEERKRVEAEREIRREEGRKRVEAEREIRREEERKIVEAEREIRTEEERKREEVEREIRTEEERKREEVEREIRVEEERKRQAMSNLAVVVGSIGVITTVLIAVIFGKHKIKMNEMEIRGVAERKRVVAEREIRTEEERKRVEAEREIRTEEERKRVEAVREIRTEEERKREEIRREENQRRRDEREMAIIARKSAEPQKRGFGFGFFWS